MVDRHLGPGPITGLNLEAVETALLRDVRALAAESLSRRLNADRSDHDGPRTACSCGEKAQCRGNRSKNFLTKPGGIELERAC